MNEEISREEIAALLARGSEEQDDAISRHDEDKIKLVSKQDVINLIDEWNAISFYEANEHSKECYYEMRNAIIAMQPVASCLDTISRQEAIDAFSMFAEYESNRTHAEWVDRIRVVLSSLPPVQPIRPRGHWILVSDKTPGGYWKCSECLCHKTMGFGHTDWFCPCCGADMRESDEKYQRRVKWVIPNWINTDNVESEEK